MGSCIYWLNNTKFYNNYLNSRAKKTIYLWNILKTIKINVYLIFRQIMMAASNKQAEWNMECWIYTNNKIKIKIIMKDLDILLIFIMRENYYPNQYFLYISSQAIPSRIELLFWNVYFRFWVCNFLIASTSHQKWWMLTIFYFWEMHMRP